MSHPELVFIESGFGEILGFQDEDYEAKGCQITTHDEVISQDIVCDPKIGDSDDLHELRKSQIIFG